MKNITVSVDDDLYREARVEAARRHKSLSALVREFLAGLRGAEQTAAPAADPELEKLFKMSDKKVQDPTAPPGTLTFLRVQAFPPEYNENSTQVREIKAGGNTIDFDVKTKGQDK